MSTLMHLLGIFWHPTDFIKGTIYDYFDEMSKEINQTCIDRIKQLHQMKILHGNLYASSFIVEPNNNVVIINFKNPIFNLNSYIYKKVSVCFCFFSTFSFNCFKQTLYLIISLKIKYKKRERFHFIFFNLIIQNKKQ